MLGAEDDLLFHMNLAGREIHVLPDRFPQQSVNLSSRQKTRKKSAARRLLAILLANRREKRKAPRGTGRFDIWRGRED